VKELPATLSSSSNRSALTRSLHFALFLAGCFWLFAATRISSLAAQGIANQLDLAVLEPLLQQASLVLLLLVAFAVLDWMVNRHLSLRSANALPRRLTSGQEWLRGAALGWGTLLLAIAPMVITGALHPQFWLAPRSWGLALLALITLAFFTLGLELAFRGYLFVRLIAAIGPVAATILLSLLYALLSAFRPNATWLSISITFLMGVWFSAAYLRTHALWVGWGLHFAWDAAMAVVFGLPIAGYPSYSSLITTTVSGPVWFTGGAYGPEGAALTLVVITASIAMLYRITRGYAWDYTHAPIVAMGYPMTIAPPAAHTAMEAEAAAQPASLVQIATATPANASTVPEIDEHLRAAEED
jgi:hypothetical protein